MQNIVLKVIGIKQMQWCVITSAINIHCIRGNRLY